MISAEGDIDLPGNRKIPLPRWSPSFFHRPDQSAVCNLRILEVAEIKLLLGSSAKLLIAIVATFGVALQVRFLESQVLNPFRLVSSRSRYQAARAQGVA